jgi:RNA polymerase sigma-70 factor (ECF subfamily)
LDPPSIRSIRFNSVLKPARWNVVRVNDDQPTEEHPLRQISLARLKPPCRLGFDSIAANDELGPFVTDPLRVAEPATRAAAPNPDSAFESMVESHYARLCAFALRLVGLRSAGEDVVHEVLLRIWRRRAHFDFGDPMAYLYRSVRNEAESWRRRSPNHEELDPNQVESPSATLELTELESAIEQVVSSLPPRRREIFRMQREQGLSYADIARLLGISIKTVEVQIGHALKTLRARLVPYLILAFALFK